MFFLKDSLRITQQLSQKGHTALNSIRVSSKIALTGLFCGRNNLHRGMFLNGLPRGATILPTMGNLLTPVDLVKQSFGIALLKKSVHHGFVA